MIRAALLNCLVPVTAIPFSWISVFPVAVRTGNWGFPVGPLAALSSGASARVRLPGYIYMAREFIKSYEQECIVELAESYTVGAPSANCTNVPGREESSGAAVIAEPSATLSPPNFTRPLATNRINSGRRLGV